MQFLPDVCFSGELGDLMGCVTVLSRVNRQVHTHLTFFFFWFFWTPFRKQKTARSPAEPLCSTTAVVSSPALAFPTPNLDAALELPLRLSTHCIN